MVKRCAHRDGIPALLMLTSAAARMELTLTGDFPIGQTGASQLKQDLVFDLLMAESEADTTFLDREDFPEERVRILLPDIEILTMRPVVRNFRSRRSHFLRPATTTYMRTKITLVFAAAALLGLTSPVAHAILIVAPNFPINGVQASQLPAHAVNAFLLAAFEDDIAI